MDNEGVKKRAKTTSSSSSMVAGDDDDRISKLPDSVIIHILSFLPTEDVVQTCILSKRWKLIWLSFGQKN
uniref:F-box domain-containing protein n=1 Tax=Cannabis sativa TaxID=3483 RepID=A0A803R4K9_CANSA